MPFVLPTHNQVSWGTWLRIWPFLPFVSDFAYKLDRSQSLFSSRTSGKDIWLPRPQQWTKNSDKFPWAIELLCHQFGRFFAVSDPPSLWKIDSPGFFQPQGGCHSISRLWISQWSLKQARLLYRLLNLFSITKRMIIMIESVASFGFEGVVTFSRNVWCL